MRGRLTALLAVCVLYVGAGPAFAQYNTAEISGTVRDGQGGLLPGVNVVVSNDAVGLKVERVTDGTGRFFVPALPVGEYALTAELTGFKRFAERSLALKVGQKIDIAITLEIGQLTDTITVVSEAPLLITANAEIAAIIDNRQVQQLPLNGRQFIQLAQLTDGVTIPPGGTRGAALGQAGPLPNVYGQRGGHNIYLIDGVKVTDEYFNNLVISPSIDAIQEFKIQKTMYPAEFGGKSSALVNVLTKSGANAFHGGAFFFGRHETFDSPNYFADPAAPNPPLRQSQYGVNIGGPLARDRTFFFFSYEGQQIRRAQTQLFSVPTASLRAGDFSGLPPICDPLTRTAAGTCTPFAGNQIPTNRVSPVASALLAHVPLPTSAGLVQNLLGVEDELNPMNQFSLKVDQRIGTSDHLYGRVHDVSRARHTAVRHELAERGARPGLRADRDHRERERRVRPHAYVRFELAERDAVWLSARARRPGEPERKASTSRACRASRV